MNARHIDWDSLDWSALDRLRDTFLGVKPASGDYWTSLSDLENYNFTFAQRIGWKWDAVLRELTLRGWTPPSNTLLDWGCGSGIAGRRVVEHFGENHFKLLRVYDRSRLARDFALSVAHEMYPLLRVEAWSEAADNSVGTLIVSHVLNELDEDGGRALRQVIDRADSVLWVEPGTHADSRSLIAMREALRGSFQVIAPCTHQSVCGLLAPEKERHWCHHFAQPPAGIMADSNWVRFAQRAGIDLRSLPYSFLVVERKGLRNSVPGLLQEGFSRIIGQPRFYKGFAKVFSCQEEGVRDVVLQKRDAPELFKALRKGDGEPVQRWLSEARRKPQSRAS